MNTTKKGGTTTLVLLVGAIIFGAIIVGVCSLVGKYYESSEVTFTVTEKERIMDRDGSGARYLVWSEDETFENVDTLMKGKFNSSDLYGQLKVGETYTCEVYGWRNSYFSSYRNLVKCKKVEQ